MLKLYFSNPAKAGGSYQITVEVVDGNKLVYSQQYPMHTFHQVVVLPYEAKADKNSDHALTISGLQHVSKELKVNVTFSSLNTTVDTKAFEQVPNILIEVYGKIAENKRAEAIAFHEGTAKSIASDIKAKPYSINKSYKAYLLSDKSSKTPRYLPVMPTEGPSSSAVSVPEESASSSEPKSAEQKDLAELQKL